MDRDALQTAIARVIEIGAVKALHTPHQAANHHTEEYVAAAWKELLDVLAPPTPVSSIYDKSWKIPPDLWALGIRAAALEELAERIIHRPFCMRIGLRINNKASRLWQQFWYDLQETVYPDEKLDRYTLQANMETGYVYVIPSQTINNPPKKP